MSVVVILRIGRVMVWWCGGGDRVDGGGSVVVFGVGVVALGFVRE